MWFKSLSFFSVKNTQNGTISWDTVRAASSTIRFSQVQCKTVARARSYATPVSGGRCANHTCACASWMPTLSIRIAGVACLPHLQHCCVAVNEQVARKARRAHLSQGARGSVKCGNVEAHPPFGNCKRPDSSAYRRCLVAAQRSSIQEHRVCIID